MSPPDKDPVHRGRQGFNVGTLATRRFATCDRSSLRPLKSVDWWDALKERRDTATASMALSVGIGFG